MSNNLKNIFIVAFTTLLSRISGFVRDAIFFSIFGLSEASAAFLFAFTIPNLFRRLLGEGALSSAIVPILSGQYVRHGREAVGTLLKQIVIRLSCILLAIVLVGCFVTFSVSRCSFLGYKWIIGLHFITLVLPYMIFVCTAAVISAALNVLGYFFAASLNAVWLNLTMVIVLVIGKICKLPEIQKLDLLSFGVIIGGIIQCLVPIFALCRKIPKSNTEGEKPQDYSKELKEILHLFWPGFFGAAVTQINLLISRSLAYFYSASSVSVLYLANRLIELPLGIFAIAISTVFFPDMSKSALNPENSSDTLKRSFNQGILFLLWILLPSALGLFFIKKEILSVFFEWGNFGVSDTQQILPILSIYCISIPFYGISTFLVRSFHAIKDMRTSVHIGCILLIVNVIATVVLMNLFGVPGIASANTISIILQTYMLYTRLRKKRQDFSIDLNLNKIFTLLFGLLGICSIILFGRLFITSDIYVLLCLTPIAALLYLLITHHALKSRAE
ncbi:MAG: murein biosynthesis integral membrane protein MurJ [Opitutales bacterium]|nr:murein biosynthesis integral membrane protein MurJ [Opitutales bacterium]